MATNCPHGMSRCNPGCKVWDEGAEKCGLLSGPEKIAAALEKQTAVLLKAISGKGKE